MKIQLMMVGLWAALFVTDVHAACEAYLELSPLESARTTKLLFKNTDVYRRNNDIGLQQRGDVELVKWIEVGPEARPAESFVGVTAEGRLYQIAQFKEQRIEGVRIEGRRIARPLAGDRIVKDIYLFENEVLVVVDSVNRVWFYSPQKWQKSPVPSILKRGAASWALSSAALLTGATAFVPDLIPITQNWQILFEPLVMGVVGTSALTNFFMQVRRYEVLNTQADGLIPTNLFFESEEQLYVALYRMPAEKLTALAARTEFQPPLEDQIHPPMIDAAVEGIH